jgi:nucleotide-binding universal stress UspA family protein
MFKHILLLTDVSPLSEAALKKGIQFAKKIDARVTGFCVAPTVTHFSYGLESPIETKRRIEENLAAVEKAAKEAGVQCETAKVISDRPHEAIVEAAQKRECDIIIMAFHGRRGENSVLLSSEAQKVLTQSKISVLVCR